MEENWRSLKVDAIRPGMVLLLKSSDGGYDPAMGFRTGLKQTVPPAETGENGEKEIYGSDPLSTLGRFVSLREHLEDTEEEARKLCEALGLPADSSHSICLAALLHDTGKAHPAFQSALTAHGEAPEKGLWAKSALQGKRTVYRMPPEPGEEKGIERKYFRHELASMLSWIKNEEENHAKDLIAYLIAAHHGKVRMGLRAMPGEKKPKDDILFARGVWEGDVLPAIILEKRTIPETALSLDLMQMGEGPMGASWADRTQGLLEAHGPFCLALMETLVRIADWRASKKEMEGNHE
jgi:CRISPR-associated endonuclease/helicase Cas3